MNRAERRRVSREAASDPVISIKQSEINKIKRDTLNKAVDMAFELMLAIPTMVIHDKYSLLMKKVVDGKSREERFAELCFDLYDSYEKGYVTIEDLRKCLWEEAGMKVKANG